MTDGHDFATEAVSRGAVGLICEHLIPELNGSGVVQTRVREGSGRPAMARAAAAFYGHPARDLLMAGVTGHQRQDDRDPDAGRHLGSRWSSNQCGGHTVWGAYDA